MFSFFPQRVVFLKQLGTGLLLVTGPFVLNGCPLRRVNQIYTIATSTRLKIKKVKVPSRINDDYFRRKSLKNLKHREGELFDTAKEVTFFFLFFLLLYKVGFIYCGIFRQTVIFLTPRRGNFYFFTLLFLLNSCI